MVIIIIGRDMKIKKKNYYYWILIYKNKVNINPGYYYYYQTWPVRKPPSVWTHIYFCVCVSVSVFSLFFTNMKLFNNQNDNDTDGHHHHHHHRGFKFRFFFVYFQCQIFFSSSPSSSLVQEIQKKTYFFKAREEPLTIGHMTSINRSIGVETSHVDNVDI